MYKRVIPIAGIAILFVLLSAPVQSSFGPRRTHYTGLMDVYVQNRQLGLPNYVTEDLLLTAYGLIRQATLTEQEQNFIYPAFSKLIKQLYALHKNTVSEAGKANHDYLAVLNALLTGATQVGHAGNSKRAQQELDLVYQVTGISTSPLWQYAIDYSQFKPRGKYESSEVMQRYFRAYRYAGTILFAVQTSKSTGVSPKAAQRMALQAKYLTRLINGVSALKHDYESINSHFTWQFGVGKDISVDDMPELAKNVKDGKNLNQRMLEYAREHKLQPTVIDGIVNVSDLEKGLTVADARSGFRLFPSHETATAMIFQQLTYPNVKEYLATCKQCDSPFTATMINGKSVKGFPLVDEIMAALESVSAKSELEMSADQDYKNYQRAWIKVKEITDNIIPIITADDNNAVKSTVNKSALMDGVHFRFMRSYLDPKNTRMTADRLYADDDRRLNSMKGFWTWQQYLALLYTKQPYTLTDKGLNLSDRSGAWLSPTPGLYKGLQFIVKQHIEHTPHPSWKVFDGILQRCYDIAIRIIQQQKISNEDEEFLNNIDKTLLQLTGGVDYAIVVDVHTNPASHEVLEQGLAGKIVSFKTSEASRARGAIFQHFEFKQPMSNRLTDKDWLEKLNKGEVTDYSSELYIATEKKLDGQIRALYSAFQKGGKEGFDRYVQEQQIAIENGLIPVVITLTTQIGFKSVEELIEKHEGKNSTKLENVLYAMIPPALIKNIIEEKTVWTLALSQATTQPMDNKQKHEH